MTEQKTSGLGFQVSGSHYTNMKIQPVELAYRLGATPCFTKLAKYLTRDKGDKSVNLQKARHCVTLEMDLRDYVFKFYESDAVLDVTTKEVEDLLCQFTDDSLIRVALFWMWCCTYEDTLIAVDQIISRYQESL